MQFNYKNALFAIDRINYFNPSSKEFRGFGEIEIVDPIRKLTRKQKRD